MPDAEFELTLWGLYARGGGGGALLAAIVRCLRCSCVTAASSAALRRASNGARSAGGTLIAAFERGAWDFAVSHCIERSVDATTTISKLRSFDIACRSHLPDPAHARDP